MANKYFNKKITKDGITYDSLKEYQRHLFLKQAEKKGEIKELELQPKYILLPKQTYIEVVQLKTKTKEIERVAEQGVSYTADFRYLKGNEVVVEDVKINKKLKPVEYILKRKMMLYFHGIRVREIYTATENI